METIFFHFLRQQSAGASGSSFFFNWDIFFSQSFIPASESEFFVFRKQYFFFFPSFLLLMENVNEIWGNSNFKDKLHFCQWALIFFYFFRYFLKWTPHFRIVKHIFQYPLSGQCKRIFCLQKQYFFGRSYFAAIRKHQRNFSSGNVYFNEILHFGQWKQIFRLVETVFFYSKVFPPSSILQLEHIFCQSFIPGSGNKFFVYWKQYCFIPRLFSQWKLLLKLGEVNF